MSKQLTKKSVDVRIESLREVEMKIDLETLTQYKDKLNLYLQFGVRLTELKNDMISIFMTTISFIDIPDGERCEVLRYVCEHRFHIDNIDTVFENKSDEIVDKVGIMPTLVGISFSGMRGMLALRTVGTPLENYPLPMINPTDYCHSINALKKH